MYGWLFKCCDLWGWDHVEKTTRQGYKRQPGVWTMQQVHESLTSRVQRAMFWGAQTHNWSLFRVVSYLGLAWVVSEVQRPLLFTKWQQNCLASHLSCDLLFAYICNWIDLNLYFHMARCLYHGVVGEGIGKSTQEGSTTQSNVAYLRCLEHLEGTKQAGVRA